MKRRPKNYPMDGPPRLIQQLRLNPKRTREESLLIKQWCKEHKSARPETLEAY